ncbi:MAG: hypothetical protein KC994_22760 [Candidatus Omnitrophica bacterium]|nr:hypothetical protein [Candidatus Omnitrophota bacterium]
MKYRKIPVEVDAFPWRFGCDMPPWAKEKLTEEEDLVHIGTLEGVMTATPGDFIIRGVAGEVYSCKPEIFEMTYEPIDG